MTLSDEHREETGAVNLLYRCQRELWCRHFTSLINSKNALRLLSLADPTQTEGLLSHRRKERMLSPTAVVSPEAKDLARR